MRPTALFPPRSGLPVRSGSAMGDKSKQGFAGSFKRGSRGCRRNPISRRDVSSQFAGQQCDEEQALRAFIAAMVWGYGRNGYGAYRTAGILTANPQVAERLLEIMQRTRAEGGPAAFTHLSRHRLKGLGVAFATKYLYYCHGGQRNVHPAPILDRIVSGWLVTHIGWRPRMDWHVADYTRYCELVTTWAGQLDVEPETVEYLMFSSGTGAGSQWADPTLSGALTTKPTESELQIAAVLDALDEAADAFQALPGGVSTEDAADFEHSLRALRRIVIAQTSQL